MRDLPPDAEFSPPAPELPVLPFWQARSFWMTLLALVSIVLPAFGVNAAWASNPATVDTIMQVVGALATALAWRERLSPSFQLGWPR